MTPVASEAPCARPRPEGGGTGARLVGCPDRSERHSAGLPHHGGKRNLGQTFARCPSLGQLASAPETVVAPRRTSHGGPVALPRRMRARTVSLWSPLRHMDPARARLPTQGPPGWWSAGPRGSACRIGYLSSGKVRVLAISAATSTNLRFVYDDNACPVATSSASKCLPRTVYKRLAPAGPTSTSDAPARGRE